MMGSTSMIVGEVVAPKSPAEVPTPSAARKGEPTLVPATGGEATTPSTTTCGGVAVRASSASTSPTTYGSGDLVWEGDDGATGTPCGLATGLHGTIHRQDKGQTKSIKDRVSPLSDGKIWTTHGGANPCGLVVRQGGRELRMRWLC
jgi:hypothetical protein